MFSDARKKFLAKVTKYFVFLPQDFFSSHKSFFLAIRINAARKKILRQEKFSVPQENFSWHQKSLLGGGGKMYFAAYCVVSFAVDAKKKTRNLILINSLINPPPPSDAVRKQKNVFFRIFLV